MRGCIRKRGKSWCIIVDIGHDENGKRKQKWFSGYPTKKEAEKDVARVVSEIDNGTFIQTTNITLGQFIQAWLSDYGKIKLSPKTYERYSGIAKLRVIPWLGNIPLDKLKPIHLQGFYKRLIEEGRKDGRPGELSPATIHYHHRVIHRILETAVKQEMVTRNVADLIELPTVAEKSKEDVAILNEEQIRQLEKYLAPNSPYYSMIYLSVRTGLRRGELLALKWSDVDLAKATLQVNHSLSYTKETGLQFKAPKTKKSRRTIDISPECVTFLKQLRKSQLENKLLLGPEYADFNLIFCAPNGRTWHPDTISSWFTPFLKKIGLPALSFHCLRHTHASLLLKAGVDIKVISERLGHSSIRVTYDVYAHLLPGQQSEAAAKLERLLKS
ncbi:MAG: site-specific integrase [Carboxydocellales bacterium]